MLLPEVALPVVDPVVDPVVEPVVDPVVEPVVVPVPEYDPPEPGPIVAFVRIHSPPRAPERVLLLPVVPVVPVVLLDDWSPRSRHPVTVMVFEFRSRL
jgi:hypothetical protein